MSEHPNPPAFPSIEEHPSYDMPMHHFGMSLRDWFAGQALPMMLRLLVEDSKTPSKQIAVLAAQSAYLVAAAMLAERTKATGGQHD